MSLTQYSYGNNNWMQFVARSEKTGKGFIALTVSNYTDDGTPEILEGSVVEINGAIYRQEAGNTSITGSANAGITNYIFLTGSNGIATAAWNNTAPAWNDTYQGFYTGANRCVGSAFYDGANYCEKFVINNARNQVSLYGSDIFKPDRRFSPSYCLDFHENTTVHPFSINAMNGGTFLSGTGEANHQGVCRFYTGGANANEGVSLRAGDNGIFVSGGETCEFIFKQIATVADFRLRCGYHNSISPTASQDGFWMTISGGDCLGYTYNNNTSSNTASNYTISANTWYRGKVKLSESMARVTFSLFAENGINLWTDYITTNIPMNKTTGMCIQSFRGNAAASSLTYIDWALFYTSKLMGR